jgi:hypothetical protein
MITALRNWLDGGWENTTVPPRRPLACSVIGG